MRGMARVRVFHWRQEEAGRLLQTLRSAGHQVDYDAKWSSSHTARAIAQAPPDVLVLDLSRMPSHSRYLSAYFRRRKSTRHIPMVFVGGDPEKLALIREKLPDATYTTLARVVSAVKKAAAHPPSNPIVPEQMMYSYRGRTTAQKLGINADTTVGVIDPPRDYQAVIGDVPRGALFDEVEPERCPLLLWFFHDLDSYRDALPRMRSVAGKAKLWIVWRKSDTGRRDRLTLPVLRELASEVGLVDYKICSISPSWSGIILARRKTV